MGVVLVVEDELINAALAEAVLGRDGHRIILTRHGAAALELARDRQPDLVVLDVSLAGAMTGLQVCRALRASSSTAHIPVLMLSGRAFQSDLVAGHAAGADVYLAKPFSTAQLQIRVRELIDAKPASAAFADDDRRQAPVVPDF